MRRVVGITPSGRSFISLNVVDPHPNPRRLTKRELSNAKGMTISDLLLSTQQVNMLRDSSPIINARDITIITYRGYDKTAKGYPAVSAVVNSNETSSKRPAEQHNCYIIGLDRTKYAEYGNKVQPISMQKVVVICNCADYCFTWEYANTIHGCGRILYSNGEPPVVRNPGLYPALCIASGSLVTTDNDRVPIEYVVAGTRVLTRRGYQTVVAAQATGIRPVVEIHVEHSALPLRATADHKIIAYKSTIFGTSMAFDWIPAGDLDVGDYCMMLEGVEIPRKIVSIDRLNHTPVYDLTVNNVSEFVANGFIVHNCKHLVRVAQEVIRRAD